MPNEEALLRETIDLSLYHGLLKYNLQQQLTHAPLTQTPSSITQQTLTAIDHCVAPAQKLMLQVANDHDFLREQLHSTAQSDPFVEHLLGLLPKDSPPQPYQCLITRNDYLLQKESAGLIPKQVEINTIAASFHSLSTKVVAVHQALYERGLIDQQPLVNDALNGVIATMAEAVAHYDQAHSHVLVVIHPGESNVVDQRGIEYGLWEQHRIPVVRATLEEIGREGHLKEGHLMLGNRLIALAYLRTAYTPEYLDSQTAIKGRELIEHSSAIKTPDVPVQLTGLKKIQQVLSRPEVLARFVEPAEAELLSSTFMGMHALDDSIEYRGKQGLALEIAMQFPEDYVLKPQREGGGHNLYGAEMVKQLQNLAPQEQEAYILMELIQAPTHSATLIVENQANTTDCISEMGFYGICLSNATHILRNEKIGYLVRTKAQDQKEGGVSAGYACLDSLSLSS